MPDSKQKQKPKQNKEAKDRLDSQLDAGRSATIRQIK